ncbi:hypothetical protein [uncultured Bradyrhizobium sp.]|jgi:hypothetical protein|uniref:hypothetical protein n=1 Tax=uncultured Bradyrhizobium sp. TaxID=199684 RepID=UPI002636A99B|nr:hypothetical protein [uncultured Bradyrhizobium sp.]
MDEGFLKDRLAAVRDLAQRADPFTKRRLLDLAQRYDRQLRQSGVTTEARLSIKPEDHSPARE